MIKPSVLYYTKNKSDSILELLNSFCLKVSVATSAQYCIDQLKVFHVDAIFIDQSHSLSDLEDSIEKIIKRHKNIPIVVVRKEYENRVELIKLGVSDVIVPEFQTKEVLSHIIGNSIRLSELKRQKRESGIQLKKLESRLSTIVGNTPVILFMLDTSGVFNLGLGKLWERFKVNKQFVLGQKINEVYHEYPALVDAYNEALKGHIQTISININNIIFEIVLTPLKDKKDKVREVLGLAHDVTERARSEMSLLKAKKMAENAAKIKQEFIANMSHEIRTPMNAIVGFINLLDETPLDEVQKDYVHSVKLSGENLLSLINSILDFSKIESGKFDFENEVFDLHHVINAIDKVLLLKVKEKQIEFKRIISEDVPKTLVGDANRLYQILSNLLANAVKFTEEGHVGLSVDLIAHEEDCYNLEFKVFDTGIGIPDYMQSKVWESFTQVSSESNRKYGGTGLGLSIVKKIVDQLHGTIKLRSHLGKGTEFSVQLPFFEAASVAKVKQKKTDLSNLKLKSGLKILLAEDNVMNQKLVITILRKFKAEVDLAENGLEVIKALKTNNYDAILMDIQMPEMDGIEATKLIRKDFHEDKRHIPIIAMTAHAFQEEIDKCLLVGMNAHVIKPLETENFINTLNECVEQRELVAVDFDLSYLTQLFEGDQELIREVLETFKGEVPEILERMDEAIKGNDGEQVSKLAHKAKASFKMLGMTHAVEALLNLEVMGKEHLTSQASELHYLVNNQFSKVIDQLSVQFEQN